MRNDGQVVTRTKQRGKILPRKLPVCTNDQMWHKLMSDTNDGEMSEICEFSTKKTCRIERKMKSVSEGNSKM